jgi:hypothetical protein
LPAGSPWRVHLLGTSDEIRDKDGRLYYHFPLELRAIFKQSSQFARLQRDVMFAYTGKYVQIPTKSPADSEMMSPGDTR